MCNVLLSPDMMQTQPKPQPFRIATFVCVLLLLVTAALLPENCRKGDIVTLTLERDPDETQKERDRIAQQIERLKKR